MKVQLLIRDLAQKTKWELPTVAAALGMSERTARRWTTGDALPSDSARELLEAFRGAFDADQEKAQAITTRFAKRRASRVELLGVLCSLAFQSETRVSI